MPLHSPVLALDTASPTVSVAVAAEGRCLATRSLELRRSSEGLLTAIDETLAEAALSLADLGGMLSLQGPGSFTGLRIGLATVLGFHQALGLAATAWPTLPILAAAGVGTDAPALEDGKEIVAAVDAMRGDWMIQRFRRLGDGPEGLESVGAAERVPAAELRSAKPCRLVGFGVPELELGEGIEPVEPGLLAPIASAFASSHELPWDPGHLTAPVYFRAPAVTVPKRGG